MRLVQIVLGRRPSREMLEQDAQQPTARNIGLAAMPKSAYEESAGGDSRLENQSVRSRFL